MDIHTLRTLINDTWDQSIIPTLCDYIEIPNKSPLFDPQWQQHGYMEKAMSLLETWCRQQPVKGMTLEVVRLPDRTPLLFIEIEASSPDKTHDTVLLYGHMDKQPEFTGWDEDLAPWKPVLRDGKLYGRGGADDGYAVFGSLTAIRALQEQNIPHARCVLLIEGCEESGSYDLPHYVDHLKSRIGEPSLVVCLDAECGNYDQLWATTSLRGNMLGTLTASVLTQGVHSGMASGIIPSSFRILREILDRLEDSQTGELLPEILHAPIPEDRLEQMRKAAAVLGSSIFEKFPHTKKLQPVADDPIQQLVNNTWKPTLSITGAAGLPDLGNAGNVLRPETTLKISLRLPPSVDAPKASQAVKKLLEDNPPGNAYVHCQMDRSESGWNAPTFSPWLEHAMQKASQEFFGTDAMAMGMGGSIPFMGMLAKKFPDAQFLVTGVLGPKSNAHGPNEFLHIGCGKKLTGCVAMIIADHCQR